MISAVGGMKEPPVDRFIAGYFAGAEKAAPGITTIHDYSQDWDDQAKCKELALNQIARGSDIVFQVAGGCGLGALNAAGERDRWGIGVDADQSFLGPHILTSAQKGVDAAVFLTIKAIQDGSWKGGGNATFGLKEDGVGLGKVSADVPQEDVDKVRRSSADRLGRAHGHPDRGRQELADELAGQPPARSVTDSRRRSRPRSGSATSRPRRRELASPLAVDVDVDERPYLARLVEDEVRDRERAQRVADRRHVDVELLLGRRPPSRAAREQDDGHGLRAAAASTDSTGGRCRAASTTSSCRRT